MGTIETAKLLFPLLPHLPFTSHLSPFLQSPRPQVSLSPCPHVSPCPLLEFRFSN
ncbi:MAG: hypothetical protein F6J93_26090 [Oscillatoria sp. SIO1A7]|nr:hypothetical protein [Oscillatoria sp. SIO1A7]